MFSVNCSEIPPAWELRHPELGARPWPEPDCSHFMPWIMTLCSSSSPPACTLTRIRSPMYARAIGVNGSRAVTPPELIGGGNFVPLMTVAAVGCTFSAAILRVTLDDMASPRSPAAPSACIPGLPSGPILFGSKMRRPTGSFR